jgi:hypothetical protein
MPLPQAHDKTVSKRVERLLIRGVNGVNGPVDCIYNSCIYWDG